MQCIMVSPNLILGCQPQLSETRLAKGQLVQDKAPRPSISNVILILSFIFKGQLVFPLLVHELISFSQTSSFERLARNKLYAYGMVWVYICHWELLVVYISIYKEKRGKGKNWKVFVQLPFHCAPSTKSGQFLAPLMCAILFKTLHVVL